MAPVVTMRQLLEAGVHFGHQTRRWNPKMQRFIYGERNGIYLLDLNQTLERIVDVYTYVRDTVAKGGQVLFVGTKKQAQDSVQSYAERCGQPYINQRWLGGMLTNFETMSKRVGKMKEYERMRDSGQLEAMPKKEALLITRELTKLDRNLGGIRNMDRLPQAVFVLDTKKEHIAVTEANKLGLPTIAVVDTNCDPDIIRYVIPGNDDAIRSGELMCRVICEAVEEGRVIANRRSEAKAERSVAQEAEVAAQQEVARSEAAAAAAAREARVAANISDAPAPAADAPAPAPAAEAPAAPAAAEAPAPAPAAEAPAAPAAEAPVAAAPAADVAPAEAAAAEEPAAGIAVADFTAKDVQKLRQETGAGMMDCKKALEATDGDFEAAVQTLREKGIAKAESRSDRDSSDGAIAVARDGGRAALVELKAETDFSAKAADFVSLAQELADLVLAEGEAAVEKKSDAIDDMRITKKENISIGTVALVEAGEGAELDVYLHADQEGRGLNGVIVEAIGVSPETLHEIALHIAFAKPQALSRDEIPEADVARERESALGVTKAEGKPEQAWDKIVEGRVNKWLSERVLLDQGVFGEKETVATRIGDGSINRFVQAFIGE